MAKGKEKRVSFHQVSILSKAVRKLPREIDWMDVLKKTPSTGSAALELDDMYFQPELGNGTPLLGIHKPIDPAFLTKMDLATKSVTDYLADDTNSQSMYSSAVRLMSPRTFAFAWGAGNHSPRPNAIATLLTAVVPLGDGEHWDIQPVMDDDKIRALRADADGVVAYSNRYTTTRNLFTVDDPDEGILSYTDRLAFDLDAELEVTIAVRLADQTRTPKVRKMLKDLVIRDLSRIAQDKRSRAHVTAVMGNGAEEDLNLVAERLGLTVEMADTGSEQKLFSSLLATVDAVGGENEDKVKAMIEGSP